ncbi:MULTISPECIES: C25 family cysteine peptidase [unclassified Carboxylicivirga]|uniref:C25 family cysteine peptidase n=1 Tax=Carboxylicivirga TaxID=1628153 RepID=UPI003D34D4D9
MRRRLNRLSLTISALLCTLQLSIAQHPRQYIAFEHGQKLKAATANDKFNYTISKALPDKNEYQLRFFGALAYPVKAAGEQFHQLYIDGLSPFGNTGLPALPAKNMIIKTDNNELPGISITHIDTLMMEDFNIAPNTPPDVDLFNNISDLTLDEQYQKNTFYPEKWVEVIDVQKFRDQHLAIIQIHPIRFNPVTRQILVAQSLHFKLEANSLKKKLGGSGPGSDYLVLSPLTFEAAAQKLANWRSKCGYTSTVTTAASWTPESIKAAIKDYDITNGKAPDYLLLLGDHEQMPAESKYREDDGEMKLYVTDLYYACLDGADDYLPDMAYGRLPAASPKEALRLVDKIINYEQHPPTSDNYYKNVLGCAQFQDEDEDGYADRRFTQTSEEVGDYLKSKGYNYQRVYFAEEGVKPQYYNDGKYSSGEALPDELLPANGFQWDGNANQIIAAINEGCFFSFHRDHGLTSGLGWSHPNFTTEHIDDLNNTETPTFLYSINCHSGKFNIPKSFGEKMLFHDRGGAIAVFCASNTSFSGYNDAMFIGMVNASWNTPGIVSDYGPNNPGYDDDNPQMLSLGHILNYGKLQSLTQWSGNADTHQHIFELFHLLGDPAMLLPLSKPTPLEVQCDDWFNASTSLFNIQLPENTDGYCSISQPDDKLIFSQAISGNTLSPNLEGITADSLQIVITADGHKPFIKWIKYSRPHLQLAKKIELSPLNIDQLPYNHKVSLLNTGLGSTQVNTITANNTTIGFDVPANKVIEENESWSFDFIIHNTASGQYRDTLFIETNLKKYSLPVHYLVATVPKETTLEGLLSKAQSPYYFNRNITVETGRSLVIEAGVEILFANNASLTVYGALEAQGTESEPIYFAPAGQINWSGLRLLSNTTQSCHFEHCYFVSAGHTTSEGGAVLINNYRDVVFHNCYFSNNTGDKGGAIYATNTSALIKQCSFTNNKADKGGALYLDDAGLSIHNTIFHTNHSITYGGSAGAIYCSASNPLIEGCLFYNNYAPFAGAIYLRDNSGGQLINNTLTMNLSNYGAGLRFKNESNTRVYNTVLWDNVAFSGGSEIYTYEDCEPMFSNCIIKGGESHIRVYKDLSFNGSLHDCRIDNPQLIKESAMPYRIGTTSVAKDAGTSDIAQYTFPDTDLQGGERIRHGGIDIGAYEFQNYAPTAIQLSCDSTLRSIAPGQCLGLLSASDKDADDVHSYSLLNMPARDYFTIRKDSLISIQSLTDYEAASINLDIECNDNGFDQLKHQQSLELKIIDGNLALRRSLTPIQTTNFPKDSTVALREYFVTSPANATLQFNLGQASMPTVADATLSNGQLLLSYKDVGVSRLTLSVSLDDHTLQLPFEIQVLGPTAIHDQLENHISIYPNPFAKQLFVNNMKSSGHEQLTIEIFNLKGQLEYSKQIQADAAATTELHVGHIAAGMYIIKVRTADKQIFQKLILKR